MDHRLRQLERRAAAGDPEAHTRLKQLKCKVRGCIEREIISCSWGYDPNLMATVVDVKTTHGTAGVAIPDREILNDLRGARCRIQYMAEGLASCPRCGKQNFRDYYQTIIKMLQGVS